MASSQLLGFNVRRKIPTALGCQLVLLRLPHLTMANRSLGIRLGGRALERQTRQEPVGFVGFGEFV